ncbi:MAG: hypothetical protein RLY78_137 [Pseudomonadota bacterium]|jgi:anti-anti-sigma regulatory factor|uniref:STAS domain-containing protein n=1 Tax=Pseudaquabacterium rugosum TaxID=2984194 RepID=A0ABU9B8Y8_9BURK
MSTAALQLDADLAITGAAATRTRLLAWLQSLPADGTVPTLDLSAVEVFDSAGVQLLLATRHSLAARGLGLNLTGLPAHVHGSLQTLGLATLLADDPAHATAA